MTTLISLLWCDYSLRWSLPTFFLCENAERRLNIRRVTIPTEPDNKGTQTSGSQVFLHSTMDNLFDIRYSGYFHRCTFIKLMSQLNVIDEVWKVSRRLQISFNNKEMWESVGSLWEDQDQPIRGLVTSQPFTGLPIVTLPCLMYHTVMTKRQWRIQDFPEVGAPTLQGAPTHDFTKISPKLHEIERIWTPRHCIPRATLRSATERVAW